MAARTGGAPSLLRASGAILPQYELTRTVNEFSDEVVAFGSIEFLLKSPNVTEVTVSTGPAEGRGECCYGAAAPPSVSMPCHGGTLTVRWPGRPPRITRRSCVLLDVLPSTSWPFGFAVTWIR